MDEVTDPHGDVANAWKAVSFGSAHFELSAKELDKASKRFARVGLDVLAQKAHAASVEARAWSQWLEGVASEHRR